MKRPSDQQNSNLLKISEAAKVLAVSIDTLRRWEKQGRLSPTRTPGGTRLYQLDELIKIAKAGKISSDLTITEAANKLGVSLKTLRRWDMEGKLAAKRAKNGERVYSLDQINQLLEQPKQFSIENIKYLRDKSIRTYQDISNKPFAHWTIKIALTGLILSLILTSLITAGYFFAPIQTLKLTAGQPLLAESKTLETVPAAGEVLGLSFTDISNLPSQIISFIFWPFNALSQKFIQTTSPQVATNLDFPTSENSSADLINQSQQVQIEELNKTSQDLLQQLSSAATDLADLKSSLASTNLEIPADTSSANLTPNSSFEANNNGLPNRWIYMGNSTSKNTFITNEISRSGYNSLKFVGGLSGSGLGILSPDTVTGASRPYHLAFYLKAYQTNSLDFKLQISFWDPVRKIRVGTVTKDIYDSNLTDLSSGWQLVEFDLTSPGPGQGKNWFPVIEFPDLDRGVVYLDDVSVTEVGESGWARVRPNGAIDAIGDGSVFVTADGEIYPYLSGHGSLGTSSNRFQSLYLSNASIDKEGNATFNGTVTSTGNTTISGNVNLTGSIGSNLIPTTDNFYDIGSSSYRWKDVYLSGNITSAGDLALNGADLTTSATTFRLLNSTATTLNIGGAATTISLGASSGTTTINNALTVTGATTLSSTLGVTGATTLSSTLAVTGTSTFSGRPTITQVPTSAHTGTWAIGVSTWNVSDASLYINPSSAAGDTNLLGLAVGGSVVFDVDADGDIFARNLVLTGSTSTGTTTIAGDLTVEGNTQIGDASTDTLLIYPATMNLRREINHTISVGDSSTANTAGASLTLLGAAGSATNAAGGAVNITAGAGAGTGTGGNFTWAGGAGGATGAGGAISLTTGAGGSTSGNSGTLTLDTGAVTSGTVGSVVVQTGGTERLSISPTIAIFNDPGNDVDFRIESDTNANAFVVDAGLSSGAGGIGIGSAAAARTPLFIDAPAFSGQAGVNNARIYVGAANAFTAPTGTTPILATLFLTEPNITATGAVTNATTLYVESAPTEATNNYSLWVDAGTSRFDGQLSVGGASTSNDGVEVINGGINVSGSYTLVNNNFVIGTTGTLTGTGSGGGNLRAISAGGTINANPNGDVYGILVAPTIVEAASGTHTLLAGIRITAPTITAGVATVTDTASLYISDAPSATVTGANYALWVDAGTVRFDGNVNITGGSGLTFDGATDIDIDDNTTAALTISEGTNNYLTINTNNGTESVVINSSSNAVDFALNSDTTSNIFQLDADRFTNGAFGIGQAAVDSAFVLINPPAFTSIANTDIAKLYIDNTNAITVPAGTTTIAATLFLDEPNLTATGTITNATTLYIQALPTEGGTTNSSILLGEDFSHVIAVQNQTTAATAGDSLTIRTGAGNTSGTGGALALTGGAGGATGAGGSISLTSGAGGATSGNSGAITLQVGTVTTSGNAGALQILGAAGVASNNVGSTITVTAGNSVGSGTGGAVNVTAGNGGSSGSGGALSLTAGTTPSAASGVNGGNITLTSGGTSAGGPAGSSSLTLQGAQGQGGGAIGGGITLTAGRGNGGNTGGAVSITAGQGGDAGSPNGGAVSVTGGAGVSAGTGGALTYTGGAGGATGDGGAISLTTGAGGSTSGNSGTLTLDTGAVTSGTVGAINIGTSARARTITIGNSTGATALALTSGTGSQTFTSSVATGTTSTSAFVFVDNSLTTGTGIDLSSTSLTSGKLARFAPTFAGSAVTGYGLYLDGADSTANGNTDYNAYSTLALTGNAAKTGVGYYGTVTSSSTTGDTLVGFDAASSVTGIIAGATTRNVYGLRSQPDAGAESTAGTTNVYGVYSKATADVAAGGTVNAYGLYVANGTYDTDGTSAAYGINLEPISGADTNVALCFDCDGTFGTTTTASGIQFGTDSSTTQILRLYRSSGAAAAQVTIDDGAGTVLIQSNTTTTSINLSAQVGGTAQRLCHDGADAATGVQQVGDCGGTQADLAEYYDVVDEASEGDLVMLTGEAYETSISGQSTSVAYVKKSDQTYQKAILGVVSTNPSGEVLGELAKPLMQNAKPIALIGRVPVKVSSENGPIQKGDFLTSSATPGVAMKATNPGVVVGKALQDFSANTGKILVFVNVNWADPSNFLANLSLDEKGNLLVPQLKLDKLVLNYQFNFTPPAENSVLAYESSLVEGNISFAIDVTKSLQNLEAKAIALEEKQATSSAALASLESNVASQSATLAAQIASASAALAKQTSEVSNLTSEVENLKLTPPDILLATGSATLANITVTSEANFSDKLISYDLTTSNSFKSLGQTSLGNTTVAGNFSIDGTLSLTDNSINVVAAGGAGILYLQNSPLAQAVDFFNGLVTIDKEGKLIAQVVVAKEYQAAAGQSVGTATIVAGSQSVTVNTPLVKSQSRIFVTATDQTYQTVSVTNKIASQSFTISLPATTSTDINFDWFIVNETE